MKPGSAAHADKTETNETVTVDTMTPEELRARVQKAHGHIAALLALFPGLLRLDKSSRARTRGRVRGDDERTALGAILDAVELRPTLFACLANKDDGRDPTRVETQLLRDRLERQKLLAGLAGELEPLATLLADTALVQGEGSKPVILDAYEIARPVAQHDAALRSTLTPALDYYTTAARKGARTRADSANDQGEDNND